MADRRVDSVAVDEPGDIIAVGRAEDPGPATAPPEVEVRATIHLPGLRVGDVAWINPVLPYEAECLAAGYLVLVDPPPPVEVVEVAMTPPVV